MKARIGFVSNSSSCSFIVSTKDFNSTLDLAEYMILDRKDQVKESLEHDNEHIKTHPSESNEGRLKANNDELVWNQERYEKLIKNLTEFRKANKEDNPNVAFISCNFDTFITEIKVGKEKYFFVSTCNNHDWELDKVIPEEPIHEFNEDVSSGFAYCSENYFNAGDLYDGAFDDSYVKGNTFFCLDSNKLVRVVEQFSALKDSLKE